MAPKEQAFAILEQALSGKAFFETVRKIITRATATRESKTYSSIFMIENFDAFLVLEGDVEFTEEQLATPPVAFIFPASGNPFIIKDGKDAVMLPRIKMTELSNGFSLADWEESFHTQLGTWQRCMLQNQWIEAEYQLACHIVENNLVEACFIQYGKGIEA